MHAPMNFSSTTTTKKPTLHTLRVHTCCLTLTHSSCVFMYTSEFQNHGQFNLDNI